VHRNKSIFEMEVVLDQNYFGLKAFIARINDTKLTSWCLAYAIQSAMRRVLVGIRLRIPSRAWSTRKQ
jgi:hypothetical protein